MNSQFEVIQTAAEYINERIAGLRPEVGIILGSGLGKFADRIQDAIVIPYKDIPGFPVSTAVGHKGNFIAGHICGKTVLAMQGRFHFYEGYGMDRVTLPVRVMKLLGINDLFVSNAAGGMGEDFKMGDIMILKDHINMLPNPLIGPNYDELGPRFPDMTRPYDLDLIRKAKEIASELGIMDCIQTGVYLACSGPTYETPAEYRFYRTIGADAVGMSTVPEVIVARHMGMRTFGVSVITDLAHYDTDTEYVTDGYDIVRIADAAADKMTALFEKMIETL